MLTLKQQALQDKLVCSDGQLLHPITSHSNSLSTNDRVDVIQETVCSLYDKLSNCSGILSPKLLTDGQGRKKYREAFSKHELTKWNPTSFPL